MAIWSGTKERKRLRMEKERMNIHMFSRTPSEDRGGGGGCTLARLALSNSHQVSQTKSSVSALLTGESAAVQFLRPCCRAQGHLVAQKIIKTHKFQKRLSINEQIFLSFFVAELVFLRMKHFSQVAKISLYESVSSRLKLFPVCICLLNIHFNF